MTSNILLQNYANLIGGINLGKINTVESLPVGLEMAREDNLSVYYIPFDYVNTKARIVLVGITPGFTQVKNALTEAQKQIKAGANYEETLIAAKKTGAFSGAMRPNLVAMLDYLKLNDWLGIKTCDELFGSASHLVQTTSALRFPVFVGNENYSGSPSMETHPLLRKFLLEYFAKEACVLDKAVFIPLGSSVSKALKWMVMEGLIDEARVLDGMPHPSGANAERIAYFLGRKDRNKLSAKTDADKLDKAKLSLIAKINKISQ
jgi:hypothetical protein